jgi:hypothetical protein
MENPNPREEPLAHSYKKRGPSNGNMCQFLMGCLANQVRPKEIFGEFSNIY